MDGDPTGTVDINDLTIVLANFGKTSGAGLAVVPEPSTFVLASVSAMTLTPSRLFLRGTVRACSVVHTYLNPVRFSRVTDGLSWISRWAKTCRRITSGRRPSSATAITPVATPAELFSRRSGDQLVGRYVVPQPASPRGAFRYLAATGSQRGLPSGRYRVTAYAIGRLTRSEALCTRPAAGPGAIQRRRPIRPELYRQSRSQPLRHSPAGGVN